MKKEKKSFDLSKERVFWNGTEWFPERTIREFLNRETELIRLLYYRDINIQQFIDRRQILIGGGRN